MQYIKKQHGEGFWVYFLLLDLNTIFKKRDRSGNSKHNRCVYVWMKNDVIYYIGQGWFTEVNWQKGRPFHSDCNDLLRSVLDESWTCVIISWGLTTFEARLLEAYLISLYDGELTAPGSKTGDGVSLINKHREYGYKGHTFEQEFSKYLNLEDGNNYGETFRRKVNNY